MFFVFQVEFASQATYCCNLFKDNCICEPNYQKNIIIIAGSRHKVIFYFLFFYP